MSLRADEFANACSVTRRCQSDIRQQSSCCWVLMCRNPRSDYNWTVRDPNQVEEEYRTLEDKLKTLTRGLNKRVSTTESLLKIHRAEQSDNV